jgi:hypothetical protein
LDFDNPNPILLTALNNTPADPTNPLDGTVFYYAVYDGMLTDAQISSDAAALLLDDDSYTPTVSVTPDGLGSPVLRTAGTDYSQGFAVTNNSTLIDDFDLLGSVGPASSFLSIDSITGTNVTQGATPDSARISGIAAGATDSAFVWYTVASSTDGRVDTLYLQARSVTDTTVSDNGYAEVEFEGSATLLGRYWFNEAPSGQTPDTIYDDQASPVHMAVTWDSPVAWDVQDGHRGITGLPGGHVAYASGLASGTKYSTNLDSATQASFVIVVEMNNPLYTQRFAGFQQTGDGDRIAMFSEGQGALDFRVWTKSQAVEVAVRWGSTYDDGVRRVFHVVYDTEEADSASRVRLYENGVLQTGGSIYQGTWPAQGEAIEFGFGDIAVSAFNDLFALDRGHDGTVYYFAVYAGELTDAQISTDATALLADDDNAPPSVTVTPDGAAVLREAGTDYSQDFAVTNNGGVIDDFDLLTSVGPASSFLTVDSITGANVTQGANPDSARITGIGAGATDSATVWYTVASSTDGRVDTLYLQARSITDTTASDNGYAEVEFDDGGPGGPGNVLMIISDPAVPEPVDDSLRAYLEGQGLTLWYANDNDTRATYDSLIAANNIMSVYVSATSGSAAIGVKTYDLPVGVVQANVGSWDNQELSGNDGSASGTQTDIIDNTHWITQPFSTGLLNVYAADTARGYGFGGFGSGAQILAQVPGAPTQAMLLVYDSAATLEDATAAPARRVGIFPESEDWNGYTADAKTLIYRSVVWAQSGNPVASGLIGHWTFNEGSGQTVADASPSNNDGTRGLTSSPESGDPTWACSGTALDFDGSDDEVKLTNVAIGNQAAWTLTAWIKMGPDAVDKRTIYGEGQTAQEEYLYLQVQQADSTVTFYSEQFPGTVWTELNGRPSESFMSMPLPKIPAPKTRERSPSIQPPSAT